MLVIPESKVIGCEDELTLGHIELIGPLVKAIQDLSNIIKGLQVRIEILENRWCICERHGRLIGRAVAIKIETCMVET